LQSDSIPVIEDARMTMKSVWVALVFLAAPVPKDLSDCAKFAENHGKHCYQFSPEGYPGWMPVGTAKRLFFRI